MSTSPRLERYKQIWSDEVLDQAINIPPIPVQLHGRDAIKLANTLDSALRGFFQADRQIRKVIRHFLSVGAAHAECHMATDHAYVRGLYRDSPWGSTMQPAICLTGLAGTGKSDLLRALARLLGGEATHSVPGHANLMLRPVWPLSGAEGLSLNALLLPYVAPCREPQAEESGPRKGMPLPRLISNAKRASWRQGTCLLLVDELQYMSLGVDSNSQVTAFLTKLLAIGPRLGYCANFSLLHKLMRRKQEDHQRLLSRPLILEPLAVDDSDWENYLRLVRSVAPDVLEFEPTKVVEEMHRYTFGTKRLVVELVVLAFRLARERNRNGIVGQTELLSAYRHFDYTVNREAVELLHRQAIGAAMLRSDLWCPLGSSQTKDTTNPTVVFAASAIRSFDRRVEEELFKAVIGPNGPPIAEPAPLPGRSSGPTASVMPLRRRKATKEDLIAGAKAIEDLR